MNDRGVQTLYGRWLIDGAPRVLLFDIGTAWHHLDEWKADLWSVAGIPSPPGDTETNDAIVLGYLVAWFLGEVTSCTTIWSSGTDTDIVYLQREDSSRCRTVP